MSETQIQELTELSAKIQDDSSYILSDKEIDFVQSILSYIDKNPYSFADVLGPLISTFLADDDDPINDDIEKHIQDVLTAAAMTVVALSDEDIATITEISNTYNTTQEFNSSTENVEVLNQAMRPTFLPFGLFLLYPALGRDNTYVVGNITKAHPAAFNAAYTNRYNTQALNNRNAAAVRRNQPGTRGPVDGSVRRRDGGPRENGVRQDNRRGSRNEGARRGSRDGGRGRGGGGNRGGGGGRR